jgi:hypothetical protein
VRLVLPRAAAASTLLVAAAAAALVATVLLTAFVQYAYLLPQAGVRQAVADASALERSVMLTAGSGGSGEDVAARDRAARELFSVGLAGVPLTVYGGGAAISQRLPDDLSGVDAGAEGAYALVGFLEGLEEHAELVAGAWPQPVGEDEPAQVALPRQVAEDLGLSVGDRVEIVDEVADLDRPVVVSGVWEARDHSQAYWALLGGISTGTGQVWGPFVVHPDEYLARYRRLGTLEWLAVADPGDLARAGMPAVAAAVADLRGRLQDVRDRSDSPLDETARLRTGLDGLAERLTVATVVNRSGLVLPAALLGVIAAYGLVLVARLLAAHRRGENALLRARGASRQQLVRLAAAEAVLAVGPAALLGAPVGTWLVRAADARAGDRSLGLAADLAPYGWAGPPLAWVVAVLAAAGCAVALAVPAAGRGRTWVAEQQERSRPSRAAAVQRAGVDVALVVVAGLAWWQLRQYGQAVTPRSLGGLGVDPLLVSAPVLAVLAATAVALRLLPLATRWGVRVAGRRDAFPALLGMWQADRRPHAGPVLLLVLAVATAVLAPTVAATWQQSQRDQAAHAVGADLRLEGSDPRLDPQVRQLTDLPQVDGLAAVHRTTAALPDGSRVPVLAIDSDRAAHVVQLREDLAPGGAGALFGTLREGRPQPTGIPLPEDAQRLTGTLRYDAPRERVVTETFQTETGPQQVDLVVPAVLSRPASIYVANADGVVSQVELARPESGRPMTFDLPLPPGTVSLVGLEAGMRVPMDLAFFGEFDCCNEPVELSWRWDLAVVDGDGNRVPLQVPDTWSVRGPQPGGPTIELIGDGLVRGVVDFRHGGATVNFLVTEPLAAQELPALVTPGVLSAMGARVGDVADLPVGGATIRIAGTVAALPGTEDGEGIAVDLVWLSLQRYLTLRTTPAANEWWVATADPATVAAQAEQLGLSVHDRRGATERLLGDPLGTGVLLTLWAAAAGGALLAAFGLAVDARANAVRRRRELAVLHTLGTSPAGLARALVVEQSVLAGLGVVAGLAVGVGVAVAMGTSLVLTPAGRVPVPEPLLRLVPAQLSAPTLGLFLIAVALGALVARRARREVTASVLRIGEE